MNTNYENHAIECSVDQCRYHCGSKNYCSLNTIQVGTHERKPKDPQCVDCNSFSPKA